MTCLFWVLLLRDHKQTKTAIVDPLLEKYSATGIDFALPLSAQAQQAKEVYTRSS